MIIGLTGKNGAGKTKVVDYLKSKGFETFSLSDILRKEVRKKGLAEERENLIKIGNELREKYGPGILAKLALDKTKRKDKIAIDSIRNPYEIEELKKSIDFILIGIDAPIELRYIRIIDRKRVGENISLEQFIEIEEKENSEDGKKQQLNKCLKLADKIIENTGTVEELYQKIDFVLKNEIPPFAPLTSQHIH